MGRALDQTQLVVLGDRRRDLLVTDSITWRQATAGGLTPEEQLLPQAASFYAAGTNWVNGVANDLAGYPEHSLNGAVRKLAAKR